MKLKIKNAEVKISKNDLLLVSPYKWYLSNSGYAVTNIYLGKIDGKYRDKTLAMHTLHMDTPKGMDTDHINGDKLDNRRKNLRVCTRSENMQNKSVYSKQSSLPKGVTVNGNPRSKKKYTARINKAGKAIFLGNFYEVSDAAKAYGRAVKEFHGEFAWKGAIDAK